VGKSRTSRNSTSSRVENQLKTIKLSAREVKKKRVAIVDFRMNERRCNSLSRIIVKSISDSAKITDEEKARFGYR
jgi:hypothetical protein